jgi:PAS domain S-box-containing protein
VAESMSADDRRDAQPDPGGTGAIGVTVYQWDLARGKIVHGRGIVALVGEPGAADPAWWLDRVHPDDLPRLSAAREAALTGDATDFRVEYRVRHADGRWINVLDHGLVACDRAGRARRIVGATIDLSGPGRPRGELRSAKAEAQRWSDEAAAQATALHASGERLRLATRAAGLCLWDYDVRDDALDWTEECRALFGLAPDARVTQGGFLAAVHSADRERVARAIQLAFHEYAEYEVEFRIVRPDGEERWVAAVGDCLYDALGAAERFLGVMIDVTDRKRTEAALRESEERFRQLAESIDDVFWVYDARAARQTYVSPGYTQLFEQDPQALYRNPDAWLRSVHPDDRARMDRAYAAELAQREFSYEYRIQTPAGVRWARDRGVVVRDAAGQPVRVVGLSEDITERRYAEEILREADRRKNEFLALLAHELRGPLAPLGNAVELLRLAAESRPDLRRVQGMLARQLDHLSRLVDDLVDLARIVHGALEVRVEPLDAATVVERALELARPTIEARRLALAVDVAAAPMPVHGDLVRLTQALANVLHNAAKYTPHGGRVSVVAAPLDGVALITVSDTGVGIPAPKLERIFEPFVQGNPPSDAAGGGLGIGLTLVKRFVQLHGGTVTAASAGPGEGSRFVIALPLAAAPARGATASADAVAPQPPSRRVLVVDDNRDSADSMMLLLRALGHDARACYGGEDALALVRQFDPELVLLDIALPGIDGYEVARRLRGTRRGATFVLAAMSGFGRDDDRRRTRAAGFDHHLVKPVDRATLEALLESPR